MAGNLWTEEELLFLKNNYLKLGASGCAKTLNRSISSITQKANRTGVKSGISLRNNTWSVLEDIIIESFYPEGGVNSCIEYLPKRTKAAINHRAMNLGVTTSFRKAKLSNQEYLDLLSKNNITDVIPVEKYSGYDIKSLHKCKENHTWSTTPSIVLRGSGCPECSKHGFDPNKPGILYYLKIDNTYYKVGITNRSIKERFLADKDKTIEVLLEKFFESGLDAQTTERLILKKYKDLRLKGVKILASGGNTELFVVDILRLDTEVTK
jgi:hypothetical protein